MHLDAFVDDRPENCLDIAVESKAKVILVWHGDLKDVPAGAKRLGVRPVTTISEAVALLEQLDDVRSQPSLMRSIKRALRPATIRAQLTTFRSPPGLVDDEVVGEHGVGGREQQPAELGVGGMIEIARVSPLRNRTRGWPSTR